MRGNSAKIGVARVSRQTKLFFFPFWLTNFVLTVSRHEKKYTSDFLLWTTFPHCVFVPTSLLCEHQNQRIILVAVTWLNGNIAQLAEFTHTRLVAVGLCDLSFFEGDQTLEMESLFKGSSVFSGFLDTKCTSDHGSSSVFQDMCAFVSMKKKTGQTVSRDVINDQICLQLRGLADSCDWISAPCGRGRHPSVTGQKEITGQIYHFMKAASSKTSENTHSSPSGYVFSKLHKIIFWIGQRIGVKFCKGNQM